MTKRSSRNFFLKKNRCPVEASDEQPARDRRDQRAAASEGEGPVAGRPEDVATCLRRAARPAVLRGVAGKAAI